MQSEAPITLGSEMHLHSETNITQDGGAGITASTTDNVLPQQPGMPVKKPTRQWAAWTRQEEESFFAALRQVGKNFDKITCRVQSKNKDQVRHYYYRLVRRINKLLGPGLCLDAKNSKDTNAAMLRWWSLLEKYSCKASKLHLKPRRFKIFVEALEHQLLKDRKKNVRKRSQGENFSPSPNNASNHNRTSGHDNRAVRLVLVDSQNIPKLGSGKPPLKRPPSVGVNRSNGKTDSNMKRTRQRKKPGGVVSSAAYKKWEKAAIAGVSLVADAAEHLERTATNKEVEDAQSRRVFDPNGQDVPPFPSFSKNQFVESNIQACMKLKLQLFPIDDATRSTLEKDKHNPHLELTLSTRKKISSVMEHLNRKWGNSTVACGELMLFPFGVQREKLAGCQRWTQDTTLSAADVHAVIGSPSVFRLRYGWISKDELALMTVQERLQPCCLPGESVLAHDSTQILDSIQIAPSTNYQSEKLGHISKDQLLLVNGHSCPPCPLAVSSERSTGLNIDLMKTCDSGSAGVHCAKELNDAMIKHLNDADELRSGNNGPLSAGEWADSLTNVSIGDLLEASHDLHANCNAEALSAKSPHCMPQISFSCDSFDAAIAAHISRYQNKMASETTLSSHAPSIWDAEETCDAFSFQRNTAVRKEVITMPGTVSSGPSRQMRADPVGSDGSTEELDKAEKPFYLTAAGNPLDDCQACNDHIIENPTKDVFGLTDIYWPDSLGPLDLDVQSSKYHPEDLIISDSLSSLNRLMASSLDAFQNCSFFGTDKKESGSTVEA